MLLVNGSTYERIDSADFPKYGEIAIKLNNGEYAEAVCDEFGPIVKVQINKDDVYANEERPCEYLLQFDRTSGRGRSPVWIEQISGQDFYQVYDIDSNIETLQKTKQISLVDGQYQKETDIANTYILCRRKITVTLYFQPVVSAQGFQNGISLYRTTTQRGYYAPDFILKFSAGTENRYVILDSKFSKQHTIKDIYLPEIIKQYSNEIAATEPVETPQMVWALQGRVEDGQKSLWELHVSPLARKYRPQTSFGIIAINTLSHNAPLLWREFERIIETLDT